MIARLSAGSDVGSAQANSSKLMKNIKMGGGGGGDWGEKTPSYSKY